VRVALGQVFNPDGTVTISPRQLKVHRTFETLAVFAQAPFMLYLASQKKLPGWARLGCLAIAGVTLYVDGGLLATWAAGKRGEPGVFGCAGNEDCGCGCK